MAFNKMKSFKHAQQFYGQLVLGPPGAGKTTYCDKMSRLLMKLGRNVVIVNLDPSSETSYTPDIDIRNLIVFEEVMENNCLGHNGALLYCMQYLEKNIDWLFDQIDRHKVNNMVNFIFDLPGQVELYIHHSSLRNIFSQLHDKGNLQLCVVHLIDSHLCSDAGKFISGLMLSLNAMLNIGLPHINLLTKIDLLKKHMDKIQFGLDFYTEVLDLNYLLESLDSSRMKKYKKLNSAVCSLVEDYGLVSFQVVNIKKEESLIKVKTLVDKANGYIFKTDEGMHINTMLSCAMGVVDNSEHEFE